MQCSIHTPQKCNFMAADLKKFSVSLTNIPISGSAGVGQNLRPLFKRLIFMIQVTQINHLHLHF